MNAKKHVLIIGPLLATLWTLRADADIGCGIKSIHIFAEDHPQNDTQLSMRWKNIRALTTSISSQQMIYAGSEGMTFSQEFINYGEKIPAIRASFGLQEKDVLFGLENGFKHGIHRILKAINLLRRKSEVAGPKVQPTSIELPLATYDTIGLLNLLLEKHSVSFTKRLTLNKDSKTFENDLEDILRQTIQAGSSLYHFETSHPFLRSFNEDLIYRAIWSEPYNDDVYKHYLTAFVQHWRSESFVSSTIGAACRTNSVTLEKSIVLLMGKAHAAEVASELESQTGVEPRIVCLASKCDFSESK